MNLSRDPDQEYFADAITELEARDSSASSGEPALLEVAALRTRLMAERDAADGFARIPIAHLVECRADQRVVLEDRHIATVLDARAAPRLRGIRIRP